MPPNCPICLSKSPLSSHFGTLSWRACAAFFRRFSQSTSKTASKCTCGHVYPAICRQCRMEKCLVAGMRSELVKGRRDPIGPLPSLPAAKSHHHLDAASHSYRILDSDRSSVHHAKQSAIDMYQVSCVIQKDLKLLWKMLESSFCAFRDLSAGSKRQLFSNFYLKWSRVEAAMFAEKYHDTSRCYFPSGEFATSIEELYRRRREDSGSPPIPISKLKTIFEPYWRYHQENVLHPLLQKRFTTSEYMALLSLLLWDPAYSNLSEEAIEACCTMRNIVLRELKGYCSQRELRFLEIVDTLSLIDRAQFKAQEEIQMCSFYEIELDSEFQKLVLEAKF